MRVLIIHNRYRQPGGEDAVVGREAAMLRAHGIEVLEHEAGNEVEHGVIGNVALLARSAWSRDSHDEVRRICNEFRPDVAHVHNFWMRLTPSVHAAARESGAATVQTLHNYRLVCANGLLLREGKVCEDCVGKSPWRGVVRRCYRGSVAASGAAARLMVHNRRRATWTRDVDAFITPSESARERFMHADLPGGRVFVKPNFTDDPGPVPKPPSASMTLVFAGRLSPEKGVAWLISAWATAWQTLPQGSKLILAGDGPDRVELETRAAGTGLPASAITFTGQLRPADLLNLIRGARAMVVPSICLETFGSTVVEAFACGRPAIVSDLGGPAELVRQASNGIKVPASDPSALSKAIQTLFADDQLTDRMGANARSDFLHDYTSQQNFKTLSRIYDFAIRQRRGTHVQEPAQIEEETCPA